MAREEPNFDSSLHVLPERHFQATAIIFYGAAPRLGGLRHFARCHSPSRAHTSHLGWSSDLSPRSSTGVSTAQPAPTHPDQSARVDSGRLAYPRVLWQT